ncbi:MAG: hypothetical protein A3K14_02700, partial [Sulfurimonas sp. RIFCSPLOWO2_12_FULL_36_74]
NPNNTLEEKLYLVSQMNTLEGTFLDFNAESITANIDDTLVKNLVTSIYNDTLNAEVYSDKYFHAGDLTDIDVSSTSGLSNENALILGTDADEVINAKATSATVLAGKGDDRIYGYTGNNTYIYRTGDGADTIVDGGGTDILNFSDISSENVIIKAQGKDLIIAVAEDGKTYEELTNKVTIANWIDRENRIENITFADGSSPNFIELIKTQFITEGNDKIDLTNSNDTVEMLGGNDTLNALGGDDVVDGGAGDDTILGGDGNDTLIGGTGSDVMQGGNGNDTYRYSRGDGSDTIIDSSGNDTLRFAEGIASSDLVVRMLENGDMQIALKEDGKTFEELADKIIVKNWKNQANRIENITLFDGSSVNVDSLQVGTDGNDNMLFGDSGVSFEALGGDDVVTSGSGDDTIEGGDGNDTINSGAGNDTLEGGTGDDTFVGGLGNDTYIFNRGDGKDTIIDEYRYGYNNNYSKNAGSDIIQFGDGITKDDLEVIVVGTDVIIALKEDGKTFEELSDKITIKDATHEDSGVEYILLSDGSKLNIEELQQATDGDDVLDGKAGSDIIEAGAGDDTLIGGRGNDLLRGGEGNDAYLFERGDGIDTIEESGGVDRIVFGDGIAHDGIITVIDGNDLIIAVKNGNTAFNDLSDKIIVANWFTQASRIETFEFNDDGLWHVENDRDFNTKREVA